MERALEIVKLGMGFPAFFNDETSIQYLSLPVATREKHITPSVVVLHTVPGKTSSIGPWTMAEYLK